MSNCGLCISVNHMTWSATRSLTSSESISEIPDRSDRSVPSLSSDGAEICFLLHRASGLGKPNAMQVTMRSIFRAAASSLFHIYKQALTSFLQGWSAQDTWGFASVPGSLNMSYLIIVMFVGLLLGDTPCVIVGSSLLMREYSCMTIAAWSHKAFQWVCKGYSWDRIEGDAQSWQHLSQSTDKVLYIAEAVLMMKYWGR